MCDRCPTFGYTCGRGSNRTMMSVLGGPHLPLPDPLHGGLLGGAGFGPSAMGLNHSALLSMPLWRPTATHAPAMWCTTAGCPCTVTRSTYAELLDLYSVPQTHGVWRPWYSKNTGDSLYKRSSPVDSRESPSKELPTKILKHERMKERQELAQTLSFDREHLLKLKSKCTGTQTQISHIEHELYVNGERRHHLGLDGYHGHRLPLLPPPPHPSQADPRGSPPKYTPMETHDAPLNLSLSSTSLPSSSSAFSSQVSRPSVITCAPTGVERGHHYGNRSCSPPSSLSPSSHHAVSPSRREVITEVCDPAIEEHFRRSLGRNYDYMSPKTSPKLTPQLPPPPPLPPKKAASPSSAVSMTTNGNQGSSPNVSITGSVDEHFAKSLGSNTWSAIKAKEGNQELFTGSVDEHFAKALGDTWLRIKAEREPSPVQSSSSRSPTLSSSPRQQRHDSSMLST